MLALSAAPETQKQISETQNQKTENPKTGNAVK
jgi:hypothetical protein